MGIDLGKLRKEYLDEKNTSREEGREPREKN
jgi:hypothetical protein